MKGIIVDCKTGEIREIDDGLPMPEYIPIPEPKGIDLAVVAQRLKEFDELKARVDKIEKK